MTTATLAAPPAAPDNTTQPTRRRHTVDHIDGRYRAIPAIYLAMAAWLYSHGHITRRQLRVSFALCEMAEQRCYAKKQTAKERPVFKVEQVAKLVGGSGSDSALRELRADIRALATIGLVKMGDHAICFAKSPDTLSVGEGRGGPIDALRAFLGSFPNIERTVPMPRRLTRALAAGFRRAETLYILAFVLRSVFWKKREGHFTVDGRMKGSWVASTFDLSRRAVSMARKHLIEIGWIAPLEVHQVAANQWGVHDVVNVHWQPGWTPANDQPAEESPQTPTELPPDSVDKSEVDSPQPTAGFASPLGGSAAGFASPINKKTPLKRKLNTRRLDLSGSGSASGGNRKKKGGGDGPLAAPSLRDVLVADLQDTDRLLELHTQAVSAGYDVAGESGRIDFLAMANRALTRGSKPGALLVWLLKNGKSEFITQADEDVAAQRLRAHLNGPETRSRGGGDASGHPRGLTEDELLVEACIREAKRHRGLDPFLIAQRGKGWTREHWDGIRATYEQKQAQQWCAAEMEAL